MPASEESLKSNIVATLSPTFFARQKSIIRPYTAGNLASLPSSIMAKRSNTIIGIVVLVLIIIVLAFIYVSSSSPSTSDNSSSSMSIGVVSSASAMMSSESAMMMSSMQSSESSMMQASSASSLMSAGSSSSFAQTDPRSTVSHFYLWWATNPANPFTDATFTSSTFLTDNARQTLTAQSTNAVDPVTCSAKRLLHFSTTLMPGATSDHAGVMVHETFGSGAVLLPIVATVKTNGIWQIDSIACPAPGASSSAQ